MRRFRAAVVGALVVGLLVTVGIGGGMGEAAAQSKRRTTDPCSLLSRRDIRRIAGWRVPRGDRATDHRRGQAVCSFAEPRHAGMVQIQLHEDGGRRLLDRRRAEAKRMAIGSGHRVKVNGASAAFEIPTQGLVGFVIHGDFAQVVTLGPRVTDRQQRAIAAVVARNLR